MEDEEEEFDVYHLWGNKTQGENYHILLLAIACLIEDRLGTKAFTYGDITRGQCKRAVRIINSYLEEPIDMPDSCDLERWVKRVSNLPISELVQLGIFEDFYLGTEDAEFGNCMRDHFTSEALEAYWKKRFDNCKLGTLGFSQTFKEYMLWGFDLQKTCGYVSLVDQDGNWLYDKFIISVMNAKLYLADKNCTDKLEIDREEEGTYGINTIMAHFVYARYRNPRVNRYIPLEDIRMALKAGIGKGMEQLIDDLIDVYLAEESDDDDSQNKAAIFSDNMDTLRQNLQEEWKQYSINDTEHFKYFKKDNTVNPALLETLKLFKMDCNRKLDLSEYDQLMKKSVQERCQWLSKENRYLLIRDVDWNKIYEEIEENDQTFGRYYAIIRTVPKTNELLDLCIASMINDDFYEYSQSLA